jgi:hypothetical protein
MPDEMGTSCVVTNIDNLADRPVWNFRTGLYVLTFEALPDAVDPIQRLKALLKRAGRDLKLKCTSVRDITTGK